jgi:hypothetical protein
VAGTDPSHGGEAAPTAQQSRVVLSNAQRGGGAAGPATLAAALTHFPALAPWAGKIGLGPRSPVPADA